MAGTSNMNVSSDLQDADVQDASKAIALGGIRLYDYRCFRRESPGVLEFTPGFTGFIGPNNAGKSTLIRIAFELRMAFQHVQGLLTGSQNSSSLHHTFQFLPPMHDHAEIVNDREDPQCSVEIFHRQASPGIPDICSARLHFSSNGQIFRVVFRTTSDAEFEVGREGDNYVIQAESVVELEKRNIRVRTAGIQRVLSMIQGIQFIGAFRNAINEGGGSYFDSHLGTGFIGQWHQWKTGASRIHNRDIQRVTDDIRRLIGAESLEITASTELKTLQVTMNGRPHKLQELGSGIAQLIIVLGNALLRRPTFVAIDEPEIHLHPGLQVEFLTALASYAKHGVIFATHSIGLARSMSDQLYSIQPTASGSLVRSFERTPHYAEFLGSMGIAGLQEFGWDRILLVEGVKDVRTFQALLRLYGKDRKTVVLPLGGDALVNGKMAQELTEILRLSERVFAVVDSERKDASSTPIKARLAFQEICKSLNILCLVTERRAVENYMTDRAVKLGLGQQYTALDAFEKPAGEGFWGKGESWKAARFMTREEVDATDLGAFLETL